MTPTRDQIREAVAEALRRWPRLIPAGVPSVARALAAGPNTVRIQQAEMRRESWFSQQVVKVAAWLAAHPQECIEVHALAGHLKVCRAAVLVACTLLDRELGHEGAVPVDVLPLGTVAYARPNKET